ncbi:uncharacterized protein LOC132162892 [Corylus avellana]|uniref:uncharacterized protein LOC132162892 n=1 Tax=Corylus avellana TaxID=13451 RepID=UPI00286BA6FB|nr:uncharacterized protein LOC132162892 [Corylus avellana]
MNILNVVKVFMWRACHNALATKSNLQHPKITEDPLCPVCGIKVETTWHVLWSCPVAKDIWSRCNRKTQKSSVNQEEFMLIWEELLQHLNIEDMELMAVVARQIWFCRKAFVHGNKINSTINVVGSAEESLEAYQEVNSRKNEVAKRRNSQDLRWEAPKNDFVKVNWDAAVDLNRNKGRGDQKRWNGRGSGDFVIVKSLHY